MKTIVDAVLKGTRLPRPSSNGKEFVPCAPHTPAFSIPPDMQMIQAVSYHASLAAMSMGYSKRRYSLEAPYVINELPLKCVLIDSEKGGSGEIDVSIKISMDKIVIKAQCGSNPFSPETYPPLLEEIEEANEEILGMMMARFFSEEMTFSDDGSAVVVTILK